eukprot:TRINITY_DN16439_c0_g1_i1.p1 TRINITY_DN16439_c0_g1~~TRINITY_DN16439_c0_g1_i1.p1  ORF type:complete len:400 (-),score=51.44 TRINITY_DN16439_c0_g1_i1:94-1293(-)
MSFNFSIEGQGVKLFRSAVSNLHKINCDALGIQIYSDRVLLKSVDDADTGMMVVELSQKFFTFYMVNNGGGSVTQTQSQPQEIEAVLSIRDCLIVLKNKKIVKLDIERSEAVPNKVSIKTTVVQDGSEQIRKYQLSLLDGVEIQNLEEDLNSYATCIVVQISEIQRLLNYFRSDGEVCIILNQNNKAMPVGLMEYISPTEARINMKVERRMLITDTEQIFRFVWHNNLQGASEATFVVPYFKALLQICQDLACDVKLFVGQPGEMFVAIPEPKEPHQDVAFGACIYLGTLEFSLADKMKPLLNQQQQQQTGGNTMQTTEPQTPTPNFIATPQEMLANTNAPGIIPDTTEQQRHTAQMGDLSNQNPEGNIVAGNAFQINYDGESPMAVDDYGVPPTQQND